MGSAIRFLLGGAVLGQVVPKVLTSEPAKKCYVQCIAAGMRAKACYLDLVEQARAEVGDLVAEATYVNEQAAAATATAPTAAEAAASDTAAAAPASDAE